MSLDLQAITHLWSEKSTELQPRRQALTQLFADPDKIELRSLNVKRVSISSGEARVSVAVELTTINARTGKARANAERLNRILEFKKESDVWKVWRDILLAFRQLT